MMTSVLAFILTLSVLIVIHEYGHYRVAVACGVRVLRFSVGFGSVIWRYQARAGGTELVLCALPLGGYVKMLDEREGAVAPTEKDCCFNRKSLWQRTAIVAAGPLANLLLAVLLYSAVHWMGVHEPRAVLGSLVASSVADRAGLRSGDWVRASSSDGVDWQEMPSMTALHWELTQAAAQGGVLHLMTTDREGFGQRQTSLEFDGLQGSELNAELMRRIGIGYAFSEPVLSQVSPDGPAALAGLREGDRVISINGQLTADASQVRELIRASGSTGTAQPMRWSVERGGQRLQLKVTPTVVQEGRMKWGRVGVQPGQPPDTVMVRYGAVEGLQKAVARTWQMSVLTLQMFGKMLIGQASLKNLSGPITIADYAGQSARLGLGYYLGFLAVVSVSLGVLNLLPLPVLDGGHLLYYLFEAVTGRPVSELWLERLQRGGVVIMVMVTLLAFYNDLVRLLGLQ
jgi:regulator of sigma E protease